MWCARSRVSTANGSKGNHAFWGELSRRRSLSVLRTSCHIPPAGLRRDGGASMYASGRTPGAPAGEGARNAENTSIRWASPPPPPGQPARHLRGRGIAGGGQKVRARQVLPLEAREPGLDRCEPRVLSPQLLGFVLDLLRSLFDLIDLDLELLHHQLLLNIVFLVLNLELLDEWNSSPF